MKILLSPAKRLDENPTRNWDVISEPRFLNQSKKIMAVLKEISPKGLQDLMKISDDLADMNYERNQSWKPTPKKENAFAAGLMFDGEVYRGLREIQLDKKQLEYLSKNVFILSGLYGILSPTDLLMPYRLEMGTKLLVEKAKDLHTFWKPILTEFVNQQISDDEILLNLASSEYMGALDIKKLKGDLIDVKFKDFKDGKLKQIMVYMKKARGEMANWCVINDTKTLDDLKQFDRMDYRFDANLSDKKTLVFTR